MTRKNPSWSHGPFILRPASSSDAEQYYLQNFCPLDAETARLTGSRRDFTHDEVVSFFLSKLDQDDYYHFLLTWGKRIIGESVLNEFTDDRLSANFRIAIFTSSFRGLGLGSWITEKTCSFGFETLKLKRITLDVFAFNPGAMRTYAKAGFRKTEYIEDEDLFLMELTRKDWLSMHGSSI